MDRPDLNLLITLNAVLAEGSVARAARRLGLSPSAMSRALARLRATTGDPLLVRAGRGLVPTPRALELRGRVGPLVQEAEEVLRPTPSADLRRVARTFALRTSDGFVENFGPALIARVGDEAPGVRLRFVQKTDRDSASLREGTVDLETGLVERTTSPELRAQALFLDRLVGVVRAGHPLGEGAMTPARYASARHVAVPRREFGRGRVDEALAPFALERRIVVTVPGFAAALALARASDLVATVPELLTGNLRAGMLVLPLPVTTPELTVSMLWHPRLHADEVHGWLRGCVRAVCRVATGAEGSGVLPAVRHHGRSAV